MKIPTAVALACLLLPWQARTARLKDLVAIEGVRDNQLIGYGLVVGLAGTGDKRQTVFSAQSLTNMLEKMGVTVNPNSSQVHGGRNSNLHAAALRSTRTSARCPRRRNRRCVQSSGRHAPPYTPQR